MASAFNRKIPGDGFTSGKTPAIISKKTPGGGPNGSGEGQSTSGRGIGTNYSMEIVKGRVKWPIEHGKLPRGGVKVPIILKKRLRGEAKLPMSQ